MIDRYYNYNGGKYKVLTTLDKWWIGLGITGLLLFFLFIIVSIDDEELRYYTFTLFYFLMMTPVVLFFISRNHKKYKMLDTWIIGKDNNLYYITTSALSFFVFDNYSNRLKDESILELIMHTSLQTSEFYNDRIDKINFLKENENYLMINVNMTNMYNNKMRKNKNLCIMKTLNNYDEFFSYIKSKLN